MNDFYSRSKCINVHIFVLVMNCLCYCCQYLLFFDVFELHDLIMFLHFVGCNAFSLSHISSVFHFNLDSFSL